MGCQCENKPQFLTLKKPQFLTLKEVIEQFLLLDPDDYDAEDLQRELIDLLEYNNIEVVKKYELKFSS